MATRVLLWIWRWLTQISGQYSLCKLPDQLPAALTAGPAVQRAAIATSLGVAKRRFRQSLATFRSKRLATLGRVDPLQPLCERRKSTSGQG